MYKLMCLNRQKTLKLENSLLLFGLKLLKSESTQITKSSQSTVDEIFTNFYSIVMVQHNSLLDHKTVETEEPFLTENETLLKKRNLEFWGKLNVLENHEI